MKKPKILVIGAGFAGKRHALNLKELKCDVSIYDTDPNVMAWVIENGFEWIDKTEDYYKAGFDGAVICTPPESHIERIVVCEGNGIKNVLVEKPLSLQITGIMWNKKFNGNIMMAHNYLFEPELYEFKKGMAAYLVANREWEYVSHDWLPNWHGVDFANNYKDRHEAKDGCMAVSAPHHIYILDYLFGLPDKEVYFKSNQTILEMEGDNVVTGYRENSNGRVTIVESWIVKGGKVHHLVDTETKRAFDWMNNVKVNTLQTYKTMMKCWLDVISGARGIPELCQLQEGIRIVKAVESAKYLTNEYK